MSSRPLHSCTGELPGTYPAVSLSNALANSMKCLPVKLDQLLSYQNHLTGLIGKTASRAAFSKQIM